MPPPTDQQTLELALEQHNAGHLTEAEALYRQVLSKQPDNPDALHLLGMIAFEAGNLTLAQELIGRAISHRPSAVEFHNNLGLILAAEGRLDESAQAHRNALKVNPKFPEAWYCLGIVLYRQTKLDEAIKAYQNAIALSPQFADAHNNLANVFRDQGQLPQAIAEYQQANAIRPNDPDILSNLASVLHPTGQLDQAIELLRKAIALNPNHVNSFVGLGNALKDAGELTEAIRCHQRAVELAPDQPAFHSNLIVTMLYEPTCTIETIYRAQLHFRKLHGEPRRALILPFDNLRDPDRRLRIGYVSADFWNHASAFFFVPLLKHHDLSNYEIICYSNVPRPDAYTAKMRSYVSDWRDIHGLKDDRVAQMIHDDQIDILVDAKVHTADNSLPVFARKPAPIQVTWLGHPGTTGLDTVDYRFTDPFIDPPGLNDAFYSEQSIRLPHCFWCYDPLATEPQVNESPAEQSGYVTFGCLNNFCKVNNQTLDLWSQILRGVPNSRLILLTPQGKHRSNIIARLGISEDRLELIDRIPRPDYLKMYHRIDIVLDTFPYNGHTTSFDALWMGVPFVSLTGRTPVSRGGLSLLSNIGLPELATSNPDDYVKIAIELAGDPSRLAELRRALRSRMQASPLMDGPSFSRAFETAFRQMWQRWCNQP